MTFAELVEAYSPSADLPKSKRAPAGVVTPLVPQVRAWIQSLVLAHAFASCSEGCRKIEGCSCEQAFDHFERRAYFAASRLGTARVDELVRMRGGLGLGRLYRFSVENKLDPGLDTLELLTEIDRRLGLDADSWRPNDGPGPSGKERD